LSWTSIAAVLITHAHWDHCNPRTIKSVLELGIPVFSPATVVRALVHQMPVLQRALEEGKLRPLESPAFPAGPFDVSPFEVPHDSMGGCFGYQVFEQNLFSHVKLTLATDIGYPDKDLCKYFADSNVVVMESNHDNDMLENSGRPVWLKQRIRTIGHLSNDQCARFLLDIIDLSHVKPHSVLLAHISQQCNTNALAVQCTTGALADVGHHDIRVLETFRSRPSEIVTL
jgi:phosphoribosyl 1,2-cyclic phosphodiesterase